MALDFAMPSQVILLGRLGKRADTTAKAPDTPPSPGAHSLECREQVPRVVASEYSVPRSDARMPACLVRLDNTLGFICVALPLVHNNHGWEVRCER